MKKRNPISPNLKFILKKGEDQKTEFKEEVYKKKLIKKLLLLPTLPEEKFILELQMRVQ